ncbi:hypothetical protein QBC43DRAFT_330468 [Cladorrhinum sp. PSN259]|nr:hypothetical protein QBC43DRAFT_330468 [Cladorrhinum sp. PSN259]
MSGLNRANQLNGNGKRRMVRSSSLPSSTSSPRSDDTSEVSNSKNNTEVRHDTASHGPQVRMSRSVESMDMSPQTPFSAIHDNNQVTIVNAANDDGYTGHRLAQFPVEHNPRDDDVFDSSQRHPQAPTAVSVTGTAVAMRSLDPTATARLDAQGIYPATACVFVANLPEPKDDLALEAAVTRAFSRFGTVFVKIRRDAGHMPFAFAQYTSEEDARRAEIEGRGTMILGRPCRTEMVKANRTYVVFKNNREPLSIQEAGALLMPYGNFSKIERLDDDVAAAHGLPQAVLIEFSGFNRNRDLGTDIRYNAVGTDRNYRVEIFNSQRNHVTRANRDEDFLRRYDLDRRSVFVSNLPADTTQNQLKAFFERIGPINKIDVVMRHHQQTGVLIRVFGFIEFADYRSAPEAIATLNDANFLGCQIKVQRKITKGIVDTPTRSNQTSLMQAPSGQLPETPVRAARYCQPTSADRPAAQLSMNASQRSSQRPPPYTHYSGPQHRQTSYPGALAHGLAQPIHPSHSYIAAPGFGPAGNSMAPNPQAPANGYSIPPNTSHFQPPMNAYAMSPTVPSHPTVMVPYTNPTTGMIHWVAQPMPMPSMPGMTGAPGTTTLPGPTGASGAYMVPAHQNPSTPGMAVSLPYRSAQRGAPSSGRRANSRRSSSSGSSDSASPKQRGARLN